MGDVSLSLCCPKSDPPLEPRFLGTMVSPSSSTERVPIIFIVPCFSLLCAQVLDLLTVDSEVGGFFGGFASAGHGYLVPSRSFKVSLWETEKWL